VQVGCGRGGLRVWRVTHFLLRVCVDGWRGEFFICMVGEVVGIDEIS
jgi:hypothetical protein